MFHNVNNLKDFGIIMSSNCSFEQLIIELCKRCTGLCRWIHRTRESTVMMTLFNSLVLSRLDYGSQLWSPTKILQIIMIEKFRKLLLLNILKDFPHSPTRNVLVISKYTPSNVEEREVYCNLCLENSGELTSQPSHYNSMYLIGEVVCAQVRLGHTGTLAYSSFRWKGLRMFDSLPMHIRNITACPPSVFKKQLDLHLSPILDCPCTLNFNNSLDNKY